MERRKKRRFDLPLSIYIYVSVFFSLCGTVWTAPLHRPLSPPFLQVTPVKGGLCSRSCLRRTRIQAATQGTHHGHSCIRPRRTTKSRGGEKKLCPLTQEEEEWNTNGALDQALFYFPYLVERGGLRVGDARRMKSEQAQVRNTRVANA